MRLRNIKGSKEVIAASPYVVQNPEDYKGKWSELFHNNLCTLKSAWEKVNLFIH